MPNENPCESCVAERRLNVLTDDVRLDVVVLGCNLPASRYRHVRVTGPHEQVSVVVADGRDVVDAFALDVARAIARATVESIVDHLGPHLDDCDEDDPAAVRERLERYGDMLAAAVDEDERKEAAAHYVAAWLCARAVRR